MSLRVFLARTPRGWEVMRGGFARIGSAIDADAPSPCSAAAPPPTSGSSAAAPVETVTMLPAATGPYARVRPGVLPSRAGDNLFWLGRYVERAEGTMRLLRAYHVRLAETRRPRGAADRQLRRLSRRPRHRVRRRRYRPRSPRCSSSAIVSAGNVRDRFSIDGWHALNDLAKTAGRMAERVTAGRRRRPGDERAPAQDQRLLRPRAREHVPLHRLALPLDRPQPRARHRHVGARSPASPTPRRRTARSTSRSRSATASCRTAAATR